MHAFNGNTSGRMASLSAGALGSWWISTALGRNRAWKASASARVSGAPVSMKVVGLYMHG